MLGVRHYQQIKLKFRRFAYVLRHSIIRRLLVVVFSIYLILTVIVTLGHMNFEYDFSKQQTINALKNIEDMVRDSISQSIWEFNGPQLDTILQGISTNQYIVGIKLEVTPNSAVPNFSTKEMGLVEDDNGAIYRVNQNQNIKERIHSAFIRLIPDQFDIYHTDALNRKILIGKMYLYSSNKIVFEQVKYSYLLLIINAIIKTIALWIFFLWAGYYFVSKPLSQLTEAIKKLAAGKWDTELKIKNPGEKRKTEINFLFESFNETTRKLHSAQDNLTNSENRLNTIFDTMPSALISVDAMLTIKGWNKYMVQITGIQTKNALGCNLMQLYPAFNDYLYLVTDAFKLKKEQQVQKTFLNLQADNESRIYNISVYPILDVIPLEAVIRIDDVTEQERFDADLAQVEKLASVGASIAGVAHEINNPLSSIMQCTQNIVRRLDPQLASNQTIAKELGVDLPKQYQYLQKREITKFLNNIHEAGERASSIVRNMLKFTRRANSEMSEQDLLELIDDGLQLAATDITFQEHSEFKQINIIKNFTVDRLLIQCNPMEIQQVIINLIKNSVQAIEPTQEHKEISINVTQPIAGKVRIDITDNGQGMSEQILSQIFQPFFTTKPVGKGTGLGLSVCRNIIVQKHHGTMEVKSTVNVGTTFTIVLPISQPQQN